MHIDQAKPTALKTSIKLKKSVLFVCYALLVISSPLSATALNTNLPITIDLPIQPLAESLKQYSKKSGISIAVDSSLVQGKLAPAIKGNYDNTEALAQLLSGSGLEANMDGSTAVIKRVRLNTAKTDTMQLKPVEVRAKRFYQIGPLPGLGLTKEEIPGNVQSISAKEIKESHALSLSDLMNSKLQSVNVNDYQSNPFQMDVTYRGFTASPQIGTAQGLSVFLDGVRVNEPFGDVVNWDMIPLNALAGIDVFPGSNPIFGLGTLGGAISMRTKSGFDANEGSMEVLGGSFNRKQFQGSVGGNNGVLAGFVSANVFMEDGWRDNSPSKVNQVFSKLEWRNETVQLGLSTLYAGNKLVGNGLLPTYLVNQDPSQIFTSPDETKNRLLQFQLTGMWDVSDKFNITGQVYKRNSRRNASTADVNNDFAGVATRKPNPGEQVSPAFADINNDGVPDLTNYAQNVAMTQDNFLIDASGNVQFADDGTGNFIENPLFDANNLAIGTNFNTAISALQGTQDTFDAGGNVVGSAPLWGLQINPTVNPTNVPTLFLTAAADAYKRRTEPGNLALIQNTPGLGGKHPTGFASFFFDTQNTEFIFAQYTDSQGFYNFAQSTLINFAEVTYIDANGNPAIKLEGVGNIGIGKPALLVVRDADGQPIIRDGGFTKAAGGSFAPGASNPGFECDENGLSCTPTALITKTQIDQVTDGASMQFNWNLDAHKFMVGVSIDKATSTYESAQQLGLLDASRNAYLDPNKIAYEYVAATQPIGLNDFDGDSVTKSIYFSETWAPNKQWSLNASARYNETKVRNTLAINDTLNLRGINSFLNFFEIGVLCTGTLADGVTPDPASCPTAELIPFAVPDALKVGALRGAETEKFSYYSFNPSFGATWQPNETINLYGNWSQGARTPSVIELGCAFDATPAAGTKDFPKSLFERRFCTLPSALAGDPYLPQVVSKTLEFGARGYLSEDIQWNASVYQSNLQDDIYFVSVTPDRSFFQSIGNTRRQGLEMGVKGKWNKLGFSFNYALTDATFQDKFKLASPHNSSAGNIFTNDSVFTANKGYQQIGVMPGDKIPGIPLHNLNASFSYDVTPDWTVGLSAIIHSSSFVRGNENNKHRAGPGTPIGSAVGCASIVTDENGIQRGIGCTGAARPGFTDSGKTPGYAVFNFSTSYKLSKGTTAGMQINNLFDREYYTGGRLGLNPFSPSINGLVGANGFNYNSNDWRGSTFLAPAAPRSAYITLTYDFDIGR